MAEGFLLGSSSGITCLASCAPVLLPLLVGARGGVRRHGFLMAEYLGGRLAGYSSSASSSGWARARSR
jgi:hypothetical protein